MVTWDDFDKIWASTSPLTPYEFSDPNYSQGWNFVGSTPPARQMWDSIQKKNDEKFKYLRDNFGTPNIVTSSSQMTDTDKVYVYLGSEAGWNNGHWYYYNEGTSSWADGGVYNSVAFVTDTTLSIAGQPADAKAVGDALALKADLAGCTFTGNVGINADFSVTGDSTLTGNVSASGDIVVVGDVSSANMTTSADATIGGALSVAGASTLTGNVSAGADITVVGDVSSANIIASNNANIGGNATVTGSVASASLTTTADGTIGGNLSVSGTTALAGTSTAPTPSAGDNSTKIATTEYVQNEVKPIETDVDIAEKDIANIKALLQGHLYDYQTDSTSAYTKSVPAGAMPYAGLESLGGKTVVMNQLLRDPNMTSSTNWESAIGWNSLSITASSNILRVTRTGEDKPHVILYNTAPRQSAVTGHKYYCKATISASNSNIVMQFLIAGSVSSSLAVTSTPQVFSRIVTAGNTLLERLSIYVSGSSFSQNEYFEVQKFNIIDLTQMFGAGNEPTIEEFEAMFPADYYAYNEGELLSAGVTEVVSEDSNNATLQTIPIPSAIRNLEGYGWSAGSVYNYVDFERKVFVKRVGKVTLNGTQALALSNWRPLTNTVAWAYNASVTSDAKRPSANNEYANILSAKYPTHVYSGTGYVSMYSGDEQAISLAHDTNYGFFVRSADTSLTTSTAINTYLASNPIDVYYELATPVETDISQYLTDDNLIEVEAGGTLTFPNSNGDDYRLPVPSEETYMIDLQEALS